MNDSENQKLTLRPYQQKAVDTIWEVLKKKNNALCVGPCGMGKTEIFIEMCKKAVSVKSDVRIMILLNKVKLVEQTHKRLSKHLKCSVYCGSLDQKDHSNIIVASIQSACKSDFGHVNWVIIDEAHRYNNEDESQYRQILDALRSVNEKVRVIGFTATPYRATGFIYGKDQLFDKIDYSVDLEDMWNGNYLVRPFCKAGNNKFETSGMKILAGDFSSGDITKITSDNKKVSAQVADALSRIDGRKKIAWACANINHAIKVHSMLTGASLIHSKMSAFERDLNQSEFECGSNKHIVFVNVLSEGYDFPPVDTIVLMCPTRSPVKYVQTVGRALRIAPNKTDALVLDYGSVIENCGPITDPRIPKKGERANKKDDRMKFCPKCYEYIQRSLLVCPVCEHEFVSGIKRKDPTLTKQAFTGSITNHKTTIYKVKNVTMSKHHSNAGNDCIKITYHTQDLLRPKIDEYFSWGKDYPMRLLTQKMLAFGCILKSSIDETVKQNIVNLPKSIEVELGKYTSVKRVYYTDLCA